MDGKQAWLATHFQDVKFVLADRRFTRMQQFPAEHQGSPKTTRVPGISAINIDKQDYLGEIVRKTFTARKAEALRPRIRSISNNLIDTIIQVGPPTDFVEAFSLKLPMQASCALLGVPNEHWEMFSEWNAGIAPSASTTPAEISSARENLDTYMTTLIEHKKLNLGDDVLSTLISALDHSDQRSTGYLLSVCNGLLVAGYETTATQIANFIYVLLKDAELWSWIVQNPEGIPTAVEELLRHVPIGLAGAIARYATEDVTVGGTQVPAGEAVIVSLSAANRDEEIFTQAEEIDLHRTNNKHLAFGYGVHSCVGMAYARIELQEAILALSSRLPCLKLTSPPAWKNGGAFLRGPKSMQVDW
ncbi:UNVERIFIED_ORG: cytochrome P450 [Rhodococcus erythropolis]